MNEVVFTLEGAPAPQHRPATYSAPHELHNAVRVTLPVGYFGDRTWPPCIAVDLGSVLAVDQVTPTEEERIEAAASQPCAIKPVRWRTPNQEWFVAVCQGCGMSRTSIVDGGDALQKLYEAHGGFSPDGYPLNDATNAAFNATMDMSRTITRLRRHLQAHCGGNCGFWDPHQPEV